MADGTVSISGREFCVLGGDGTILDVWMRQLKRGRQWVGQLFDIVATKVGARKKTTVTHMFRPLRHTDADENGTKTQHTYRGHTNGIGGENGVGQRRWGSEKAAMFECGCCCCCERKMK